MQKTVARMFVLALSSLLVLSGCLPRGESKSLDQVYQTSRARFAKVQNAETPDHVQPVLNKVVDNLELASKGTGVDVAAVASGLADLTDHASYTNRPAFAELAAQYRALSAAQDSNNPAGVKLLASRTFSLIASELETARFKL